VEYRLSGIEQIQIHSERGFDFAEGLRSILRQDPNIIMLGEIRDKESAEIAMNAALTGHLVLTTIHANSAQMVMPRFLQMGVSRQLIELSVILIVMQSLESLPCQACDGRGCEICYYTGKKGRRIVASYFKPSDKL